MNPNRKEPTCHASSKARRSRSSRPTGVEQVELERPREAVEEAGAETELLSLETGEIQAMNHDIDKGDTFAVDRGRLDASAGRLRRAGASRRRAQPRQAAAGRDAIAFLQDFFAAGKPVGVICHGPWTLVEADLVRGRTLTSYPSIRTDIRNAGGDVVDEEVVVDQGLVSSRTPTTWTRSAPRSSRSSPRASTACTTKARPPSGPSSQRPPGCPSSCGSGRSACR